MNPECNSLILRLTKDEAVVKVILGNLGNEDWSKDYNININEK